MTLDGCGKPQVIADGLTLLITDGLPMRRPAVHESGCGTFETCRLMLPMSVLRPRPEVVGASAN